MDLPRELLKYFHSFWMPCCLPPFPIKKNLALPDVISQSGPLHHVVHAEHGHVHPHPVAAIGHVQQLPQHVLPTGLRPGDLVKGSTALGTGRILWGRM